MEFIAAPTRIPVPGGKVIDEYVGRANTGTDALSVAHMQAPGGWEEPAQTPQFDEITLVLRGVIRVEHADGYVDVAAGQAVLTKAGDTIRYTTPYAEGAEYVAICVPAFSPELAARAED